MTDIGRQLLNVPMGDMIREMAFAIADAQHRLDASSIESAEMMGGLKTIVDDQGNVTFNDSRVYFGAEEMTVAQAKALQALDAARDPVTDAEAQPENDPIDKVIAGKTDDKLILVPRRISMLELGFAPTFYQFVDTIIEVKISISITQTTESTQTTKSRSGGVSYNPFKRKGKKLQLSTSQVNASYSSKYSYSAEGSSLLRTKLVPIPTPEILERRIEALMEAEAARRAAALPAPTPTPP